LRVRGLIGRGGRRWNETLRGAEEMTWKRVRGSAGIAMGKKAASESKGGFGRIGGGGKEGFPFFLVSRTNTRND